MSFGINYISGGMLDRVRAIGRLESGRFDFPHTPENTIPYVTGGFLETNANSVGHFGFKLDQDVELQLVAYDNNTIIDGGMWSISIDDTLIIDKSRTPRTPEGYHLLTSVKVKKGSIIKLTVNNDYSEMMTSWFHCVFLCPEKHVNKTILEYDLGGVING